MNRVETVASSPQLRSRPIDPATEGCSASVASRYAGDFEMSIQCCVMASDLLVGVRIHVGDYGPTCYQSRR